MYSSQHLFFIFFGVTKNLAQILIKFIRGWWTVRPIDIEILFWPVEWYLKLSSSATALKFTKMSYIHDTAEA